MGKEKAMKIIEAILEKEFERIQTPTLLPLKDIEPFIHPDHHGQIAKMISPSGDVLALRYDSTLSLVVSESAKKQKSVYYMEPKFSFDFNKNCVVETMQIGIERFTTEKDRCHDSRYFEMVSLAEELAQSLCEGPFITEVSHTDGLDSLIGTMALSNSETLKLKHTISRKNKQQSQKLMTKNKIDLEAQQKLLALMDCRGSYVEVLSKMVKLSPPEGVLAWVRTLEALDRQSKGQLVIEPTASDRLGYYRGNTFKIYDISSHREIISGGCYAFDAFGVEGVGFSIYL